MSTHHYIEDAALLRTARSAVTSQREKDAVQNAVERWLARQRTAPALVGSKAAARILGVQQPHISRLRDQGRMPDPIPVEEGNDVYVREEVEELAAQLRQAREARARKRAGAT